MKNKEIVLAFSAVFCLCSLIVFMYDFYIKTKEIQVRERNIYYDSILLHEQKELRYKDSIIMQNEKLIKNLLNSHSNQIHSIKNKINKLEKEETK